MRYVKHVNDADVTLEMAATATIKVINGLLANPPTSVRRQGYVGNSSDRVTGLGGVRVFLYTDTGINLQINGPEPLLTRIIEHYRNNTKLGAPHGRGHEHLVFPVQV